MLLHVDDAATSANQGRVQRLRLANGPAGNSEKTKPAAANTQLQVGRGARWSQFLDQSHFDFSFSFTVF